MPSGSALDPRGYGSDSGMSTPGLSGVGDALKTVVAGQRASGKGHIMCGVRGYRLVRRDHHCIITQGTAATARIPALNAYSTTDNALHEHTGEQA